MVLLAVIHFPLNVTGHAGTNGRFRRVTRRSQVQIPAPATLKINDSPRSLGLVSFDGQNSSNLNKPFPRNPNESSNWPDLRNRSFCWPLRSGGDQEANPLATRPWAHHFRRFTSGIRSTSRSSSGSRRLAFSSSNIGVLPAGHSVGFERSSDVVFVRSRGNTATFAQRRACCLFWSA